MDHSQALLDALVDRNRIVPVMRRAAEYITALETAIEEIWKAPVLSEVQIVVLRLRGSIPADDAAPDVPIAHHGV